MDLGHLKRKFINEAEALLINFDNTLIELEKDNKNKALISETFRIMHTIKGASGMFGFEKIEEITHELESLFDLVREDLMEVTSELIELSYITADHIRSLLSDELFENEENISCHSALLSNLKSFKPESKHNYQVQNSVKQDVKKIASWHILFYPNDDIITRAINLVYTFQDLFLLGEYRIYNKPYQNGNGQFWSIFLTTDQGYSAIEESLLFIMDYCKIYQIASYNIFDSHEFEKFQYSQAEERNINDMALEIAENKGNEPQKVIFQPTKEISKKTEQKYKTDHVHVDAAKLDSLMFLVSELVTTKSELLTALNSYNIEKALVAGEKIEKLSKLFNENALNLRLVSVTEMTEKFKRLIRDLARQLGKKIDFVTIGNETELDKSIIDHISEPVMHLIRNCIDHGIEMPEVRKTRRKDETGVIKIETVKSGNYVYISISDDGNGIDTEFVYNKAVEKGFINPGIQLSEKEIFDLIFLPGFSTAQSLTNVSGRGVGMDIVLKKIQEIRGEISIVSDKNSGTYFNIKLQQTISIIDTLLVKACDITYAIPLDDIESCILEAHENIMDKKNHLVKVNGDLVPFMYIEELNGEKDKKETDKLILLKKHGKVFALVVDLIIGEYQAVIKPIGTAFNNVKFLSGASLLGDGSIALLIDTEKLWQINAGN